MILNKTILLSLLIVANVFASNPKIGLPSHHCREENFYHSDEKVNVFPCYIIDANGKRLAGYGGDTPMPVVGTPKSLKVNMECYYVDDFAYVLFATNIPKQVRGDEFPVKFKNESDKSCFYSGASKDYLCDLRCVAEKQKCENPGTQCDVVYHDPFYSCVNSESTENGCKVSEKGIEFIADYNGCGDIYIKNMNKDVFLNILNLKYGSFPGVSEFLVRAKTIEYHNKRLNSIILPYNFKVSDARALGDSAAAHAPGMYYYLGATLKDSVSFKKSPFKNLKDALDHCYDWGQKQLR